MISLDVKKNQVGVTVMGQFTLDDYKEFEEAVAYGVKFQGKVNLLFDLRDMLSFSVDVAWEELSHHGNSDLIFLDVQTDHAFLL